MNPLEVAFFEKRAEEFRKALERVVEKGEYGRLTIFAGFPRECCRYANDLLAEYFIDNGVSADRIRMLEGKSNKEEYTHCWLIIDDALFVDIAVDQFNRKAFFKKYHPIPEYYVAPCEEPYLYDCFRNHNLSCLCNVGINSYSEDTAAKLQVLYDAIVQKIRMGVK